MRNGGQSSIEFMLLLAVLLGFLSVSVSAFSNLQKGAIYALDAQNARAFANAVQGKSELLMHLGDGSEQFVSSSILGKWSVESDGKNCAILLSEGDAVKKINLGENISCELEGGVFHKKISVRLIKNQGEISLTGTDADNLDGAP